MKKPLLSEMTLREKIGQMLMPYVRNVYCRETGEVADVFGERENMTDLRTEEELGAYLKKENFGAFRADETDAFWAKYPCDGGDASAHKSHVEALCGSGTVPALAAVATMIYGIPDTLATIFEMSLMTPDPTPTTASTVGSKCIVARPTALSFGSR